MSKFALVSKDGCPFCSLLKMELRKRGVTFTEIDLSNDEQRKVFYAAAGVSTVPQLYKVSEADASFDYVTANGQRLGGWSEISGDWNLLS
jgi:glutaredoxin